MQNTKKYLIIMVAVAFGIAVIAACVTLFSVKKVSAEFTVYGDSQAEEIQKDLDLLKGKNMVFLKTSDVYAVCDKYPYYEITSVEKSYPNVLKVSIAKRVEAFSVADADKAYILDDEGHVLSDNGQAEFPQNIVPITLGELKISSAVLGEKLATTDDELFYSVVNTCKALKIIDLVEEIKLSFFPYESGKYYGDAVFNTYTGVEIEVQRVDELGTEKIKKAFDKYETVTDYLKTTGKIKAYKQDNGEIIADHTEHISN